MLKKTIVLQIKDLNYIAVIEPEPKPNKAYILCNKGLIKWDISGIVKEKYTNSRNAYIHFLDVYYIQDELYFFINTGEVYDYRFSFDPHTGEVGEFIPSI